MESSSRMGEPPRLWKKSNFTRISAGQRHFPRPIAAIVENNLISHIWWLFISLVGFAVCLIVTDSTYRFERRWRGRRE